VRAFRRRNKGRASRLAKNRQLRMEFLESRIVLTVAPPTFDHSLLTVAGDGVNDTIVTSSSLARSRHDAAYRDRTNLLTFQAPVAQESTVHTPGSNYNSRPATEPTAPTVDDGGVSTSIK